MKVLFITTGGTIDKDYFDALSEYQVVDSLLPAKLTEFAPDIELEVHSVCKKDSLELTSEDRAAIAKVILESTCDKVLISHGTDTMVETAKYVGRHEGKNIVFFGAMKPARFGDSDADFNLGLAMGALSTDEGLSIAMSGQVFDAEKVIKNRAGQKFEPTE